MAQAIGNAIEIKSIGNRNKVNGWISEGEAQRKRLPI